MNLKMSASKILAQGVLQNYQKLIEITSNMIDMIALGGGFKCPRERSHSGRGVTIAPWFQRLCRKSESEIKSFPQS